MSCISVAYSGSAKITIPKFPDVAIYAQNFALPGVRTLNPQLQGPQARTPLGPTGIQYDPLRIEFLIGENFSGYIAIIQWLQNSRTMRHSDIFSDATISLLTNSKVQFQDISFRDIIPVSCEQIPFDIRLPEPKPLVAVATFDFTDFNFE
jgi:hypothetical protein